MTVEELIKTIKEEIHLAEVLKKDLEKECEEND